MRVPTTWINNDVKPLAPWTKPAKNPAPWANNVTKNPVQYTSTAKANNAWGPNFQPAQQYFYDGPNMTYDDPMQQYDYLVNTNTDNQRNRTAWGQN